MNPCSLLFLSKEEVLQVVAKENDKTRVYSTYNPKMNLEFENPKISKYNINIPKIQKSL